MLQNSQNDTTELKKHIKELRQVRIIFQSFLRFFFNFIFLKTTSHLNKQLEYERSLRRKLEHYIKKNNKNVDLSSIMNLEHESSI